MDTGTRNNPFTPEGGEKSRRRRSISRGRSGRWSRQAYPLALRMSVVQAVVDHGIPLSDVAEAFEVSTTAS